MSSAVFAQGEMVIGVPSAGGPAAPVSGVLALPSARLTAAQKRLLSGTGSMIVEGSLARLSSDQLSGIRQARAARRALTVPDVVPYAPAESANAVVSVPYSATPYALTTSYGKNINNRAYFGEDDYTTYVTQSEPSSAVWGSYIVAGWNDLETALSNNSVANWAYSTDGGLHFTASATGLPLTAPVTATLGDPAITVDPVTGYFYYATAATITPGDGNDYSGIAIYKSTDHGAAFSLISYLYPGDTSSLLDKEQIAVDPSNGKIYITYTLFASDGSISVYSWNDAANGSNVTQVDYVDAASVGTGGGLQGTMPAVDKNHNLYVAYEYWDASGSPSIKVAKSTDSGGIFGSPVTVASITWAGDDDASSFCGTEAIKGNIRINEFPIIAADLSTKSKNLYISFNARTPGSCTSDPYISTVNGGCLDVYITKSTDGGVIWSTPVVAVPRPAGDTTDKFMPWITVDGTGRIGMVYYARRTAPYSTTPNNRNWWVSAFVRRFSPSLAPIDSVKISVDFPVITNNDVTAPCYMGDYNSISANRKAAGSGLFVFWGDNRFGDPDVRFTKIVPY